MKEISLGLALGAAILAGCQSASAQDVFRTAGTGASAPLSFITPDTDEEKGIYVDVIDAIAADAGFSVQHADPLAFADIIPALVAGAIDISAFGCPDRYDPQAGPGVSSSISYSRGGEGVWVLKSAEATYASLADLGGQAVGAVRGTGHARTLEAMAATFSAVRTYDTGDALAQAVISGEIAAGLTSGTIAAYRLHKGEFPELELPPSWQVAMPLESAPCVRQGDTALLARINDSLAKLMADGTIAAIYGSYGVSWVAPTP